MAKVLPNPVTTNLNGKIGNIIFRQQGGQTVAQQHHGARTSEPTEAQKKGYDRFRDAQSYAKQILSDPWQQKLYRRLGVERKQPPNALLISNFLTPPVVEEIDRASFAGQPGDKIRVIATDDIEVVSVTIAIRTVDEALIETGPAAKVHGVWIYTATALAPASQPLTIEATAVDRPGNKVTLISK